TDLRDLSCGEHLHIRFLRYLRLLGMRGAGRVIHHLGTTGPFKLLSQSAIPCQSMAVSSPKPPTSLSRLGKLHGAKTEQLLGQGNHLVGLIASGLRILSKPRCRLSMTSSSYPIA
ncbi:MAG: hypothetical protein ACK53L_02955, partial [Pirellulaceae bacterium]